MFLSQSSKYQCGFRKGHSAQHCLLVMIEKWKRCLDRGSSIKYVHNKSTYAIDFDPPSPCAHMYAFKYPLPPSCVLTFNTEHYPLLITENRKVFKTQFWVTFWFFKWCINRSQNTKWKPKTYKGSKMNKVSGLPQS